MYNFFKFSVFFKRGKRKIISAAKVPYRYLLGKKVLRYIEEIQEDRIVVLLSPLIGDTVYGLSCIDQYKKIYPYKRILAVGNKRLEPLLRSYQAIDDFFFYESKSSLDNNIHALMLSKKLTTLSKKKNIINSNPYYYINSDKPLYYLIGDVFNVGTNYPISFHNVQRKEIRAIENYNRRKGIVILNPYSNSANFYSERLWNEIANETIKRDYDVFTNVVGEQKAIPGTIELRCDIYELYSISFHAKCIVSQRSGILDFLIPSGISMFAIYENTRIRFDNNYSLEGWKPKGFIREVKVKVNTSISEVVEEFKTFCNEID